MNETSERRPRVAGTPAVVTFDWYSALVDSHAGLTVAFGDLMPGRSWSADAAELASCWERHDKALQRDTEVYTSFRQLARRAMASAYAHFRLDGEADADTGALLRTIPRWPHDPD